MPIYAYRCSSCQHEFDVLQKISDAALTVCPECGQPTLAKQLTAAGFQLKGSGWYATDFKNGSAKPESGKEKKGEEKSGAAAQAETSGGADAPGGKEAASKEPGKESASKDSAKESAAPKPSPAAPTGGGH